MQQSGIWHLGKIESSIDLETSGKTHTIKDLVQV